jgi:hypothetical protein
MSHELTPAELDAAREELFRLTGRYDEADARARSLNAALRTLADAVNLQRSFPGDDWPEDRVREGLAMAAALDADGPGRVGLAIWVVTEASPGGYNGTPEQRRARLTELRAEKAADLARAESHALAAEDDVRGFWAGRVTTLTGELARIDTTLTPDSAVPSSLAGAA